MSNCDCVTVPFFVPTPLVCDAPVNVSACLDGELCDEITWAECVVYRGVSLNNIGVMPNDRLEEILVKLNTNNANKTAAAVNTTSVVFTGNGLTTAPLTAAVLIDTVVTDNLLNVSASGLKVQLTKPVITAMLTTIKTDPVLKALFLSIV